MTDTVDVGFVGLGTIAATHLAVLGDLDGVRLSFVADPDPSQTIEWEGTDPPRRYPRLVDALEEHQPDLVVITSPTDTHAELARQVLMQSSARVLVEKPLVHDLAALDELESLRDELDVDSRVLVAHHFAFSPEVEWAAAQLAERSDERRVTRIVCAFHDPYSQDADHSFRAYVSSWVDSGVNQLSVLARLVDVIDRGPLRQSAGGATAWCEAEFRSGPAAEAGTAVLRTSWQAIASSKRTTLYLDRPGDEIWLDHTAVTGFVLHDDEIQDELVNDGRTPRKIAHYRPLYDSVLSDSPDPILDFDTAAALCRLVYRP